MRYRYFIVLAALLLSVPLGSRAQAQGGVAPGASAPRIDWEVKNRFRLFRSEADFQRHVAATRSDGVLGAETGSPARPMVAAGPATSVERLCVDRGGTADRDLRSRRGARELPGAARTPCSVSCLVARCRQALRCALELRRR